MTACEWLITAGVDDGRGRVADDRGRVADDRGRVADDRGRVADAAGGVADDRGQVADGVADGVVAVEWAQIDREREAMQWYTASCLLRLRSARTACTSVGAEPGGELAPDFLALATGMCPA